MNKSIKFELPAVEGGPFKVLLPDGTDIATLLGVTSIEVVCGVGMGMTKVRATCTGHLADVSVLPEGVEVHVHNHPWPLRLSMGGCGHVLL